MKHEKKLTSREQQQTSETQSQQAGAREFQTAEELLRHDAGQTQVPPVVGKRLDESIQREPPPARPWWRRLTGG
jgi:hypothetical protein